ncbi:hypothetical protein [Nesterenkonia halotolerans]|uniref:Restriction system protein n=1 Tax=Nesterenkonia halotolerans TaxID=225325 RepID=A0ABR9J662_9MICC|nr:hypothetical protein [Nesterenkonia halotolerans]MBE1514091.1 restriction system protein [Nesterenkonia halotolerans]
MEREATAAHVEAKQAEVEQLNAELASVYDGLDTLLEATLNVDDFVDLEKLRRTVRHPPFAGDHLRKPVPPPAVLPDPEAPVYRPPAAPSGLFGRKKKLAEAQAKAESDFEVAVADWEREIRQLPLERKRLAERHANQEVERQQSLQAKLDQYEEDYARRERAVAEHNASLDQFIANLSYGAVDAVQEYIGIVLANSVYPEGFTVEHDATFDPANAELALKVQIPAPDSIPRIKTYRYVKASDEVTPTALSQKDAKDRYSGVVHQVALRTIHEVFEADRRNLVQGIALEVGTNAVDPATGREAYVPFVAVAASREVFSELDLSAVVPAATLEHLGAALSKNPLGLVPANGSGVRRS